MPRANRYLIPGRTYHLTHRCHDRSFLLKFAKDRDSYLAKVREASLAFDGAVLNYTLTCNHVHILVNATSTEEISQLIKTVAGEVAQNYNRRKDRSGAFWEGRFEATMIEDGEHLWNSLKYIDLNMVRAGIVTHPKLWKWNGYHELMGLRQRYSLIDLNRLLELLRCGDVKEFRLNYEHCIQQSILKGQLKRDPIWTESVAVGSPEFIEKVMAETPHRRRWIIQGPPPEGKEPAPWTIREEERPYSYRPF